jgi:hypothetical protein
VLFFSLHLVLHFVLVVEKLSYHLHFFQVLIELILPHRVSHHLFHVKLVFLAVGQSSESVFFVTDFLLELALESFVEFMAKESFLGAIVVNKIGRKTTDKSDFSDFLLSFDALSELVFFGEVGRYFGGLILFIVEELGVFFLLDLHEGRRPGLESHFVFLLFVFLHIDLLILDVAFLLFRLVLLLF